MRFMRVFPKLKKDFAQIEEDLDKTTFAEARQQKYNNKVNRRNSFDAQVESAELAWENTPAPGTPISPASNCSIFYGDLGDPKELGEELVYDPDYDLATFTDAEKVALLRRYYNPVNYKGTIFPTTGERPYTLDSMKTKREKNLLVVKSESGTTYDRKTDGYVTLPSGAKIQRQKSRPFNLHYALLNHVSKETLNK